MQDARFRLACRQTLGQTGVLVLRQFLTREAVASIQREGDKHMHQAYYTAGKHNIYLKPADPEFAADHPRNREVVSSKGCITTDQIPAGSAERRSQVANRAPHAVDALALARGLGQAARTAEREFS